MKKKSVFIHGNLEPCFLFPETDSEDGSSMTKADPTDPAGNQLSVLKPEMLVGPMQPLPVKTKQFAPHGHIVRADPNARPTDVVEISEDIFEKEIYRENQDTEADKELGMSGIQP